MKNLLGLKGLSYVAVAFFMFLASCSDNNKIDFTTSDATNLEGEATSDSYSTDALDVSTDVMGGISDGQLGMRTESVGATQESVTGFGDNDRLKCATITITRSPNSTTGTPIGTIVITYPADGSCKDGRGISRKGTITITYTGRRFAIGAKIVTTFTEYFIGGVKIEGTHTLTNVTPSNQDYPRFNVKIEGGKVTFLGGKTITREQNITREWQRAANPLNDKWALLAGGTASGSNRDGKTYLMEITKDLIYSRACWISNKVFIPVSGEKTFTSESRKLTINYGTGACDNMVTITINGKSKDVEIKGDGN